MEIKPIIEKLKVFSTKIEETRKDSKISKSRAVEDKKIFEISEQAKLFMDIRQMIDEMPDVRPEVQELIDKLAKEIEEGTYLEKISGRNIVDQVIARLSER